MLLKYDVSRILDVMRKDAILKSKTEKIWSWLPSVSECLEQSTASADKANKSRADAGDRLQRGHNLLKEAFLDRLEVKLDAVLEHIEEENAVLPLMADEPSGRFPISVSLEFAYLLDALNLVIDSTLIKENIQPSSDSHKLSKFHNEEIDPQKLERMRKSFLHSQRLKARTPRNPYSFHLPSLHNQPDQDVGGRDNRGHQRGFSETIGMHKDLKEVVTTVPRHNSLQNTQGISECAPRENTNDEVRGYVGASKSEERAKEQRDNELIPEAKISSLTYVVSSGNSSKPDSGNSSKSVSCSDDKEFNCRKTEKEDPVGDADLECKVKCHPSDTSSEETKNGEITRSGNKTVDTVVNVTDDISEAKRADVKVVAPETTSAAMKIADGESNNKKSEHESETCTGPEVDISKQGASSPIFELTETVLDDKHSDGVRQSREICGIISEGTSRPANSVLLTSLSRKNPPGRPIELASKERVAFQPGKHCEAVRRKRRMEEEMKRRIEIELASKENVCEKTEKLSQAERRIHRMEEEIERQIEIELASKENVCVKPDKLSQAERRKHRMEQEVKRPIEIKLASKEKVCVKPDKLIEAERKKRRLEEEEKRQMDVLRNVKRHKERMEKAKALAAKKAPAMGQLYDATNSFPFEKELKTGSRTRATFKVNPKKCNRPASPHPESGRQLYYPISGSNPPEIPRKSEIVYFGMHDLTDELPHTKTTDGNTFEIPVLTTDTQNTSEEEVVSASMINLHDNSVASPTTKRDDAPSSSTGSTCASDEESDTDSSDTSSSSGGQSPSVIKSCQAMMQTVSTSLLVSDEESPTHSLHEGFLRNYDPTKLMKEAHHEVKEELEEELEEFSEETFNVDLCQRKLVKSRSQ